MHIYTYIYIYIYIYICIYIAYLRGAREGDRGAPWPQPPSAGGLHRRPPAHLIYLKLP